MAEAVGEALATFTVTVGSADVEDFAASLGLPASPVPPTYAIRFLFHPVVRSALAKFLPDDGSLPIHIGQRFRYHRPLTPGDTLACVLSATPVGDGRPFALIRLDLVDAAGTPVCRAESEIAIAAPGFTWDRLK